MFDEDFMRDFFGMPKKNAPEKSSQDVKRNTEALREFDKAYAEFFKFEEGPFFDLDGKSKVGGNVHAEEIIIPVLELVTELARRELEGSKGQ